MGCDSNPSTFVDSSVNKWFNLHFCMLQKYRTIGSFLNTLNSWTSCTAAPRALHPGSSQDLLQALGSQCACSSSECLPLTPPPACQVLTPTTCRPPPPLPLPLWALGTATRIIKIPSQLVTLASYNDSSSSHSCYFLFLFFSFLATCMAHGSSQAGDQTHTTAVTHATALPTPDSQPHHKGTSFFCFCFCFCFCLCLGRGVGVFWPSSLV